MKLELEDKVALVCAASRGLGRAVAESLAHEGAKVAICARNAQVLAATAQRIREAGGDIYDFPADVTDSNQIKELVRAVRERWTTIHILVTNAGGPPGGTFESHGMDIWRKSLELNLMSTVMLCSEVLPLMKAQRWGRIVNIASIAAKQPVDGLILSNAARAGVLGFSKSLANEVGEWNILVNTVCPGFTLTDRLAELAESQASKGGRPLQAVYRSWESLIPLGRLGRPEEFASLVTFLASERSSYITGTVIPIDGGYLKGLF